ncbi:MAG: hypothetical protein NVSMB28_17110 [Collimonas sp.]
MKTIYDDIIDAKIPAGSLTPKRRDITSFQIGGATVTRSIVAGKDGQCVTKVEVVSSHRKKLARETAKQIREIVSTPISSEQRSRAIDLAKKAKIAQNSSITAKFKRSAA